MYWKSSPAGKSAQSTVASAQANEATSLLLTWIERVQDRILQPREFVLPRRVKIELPELDRKLASICRVECANRRTDGAVGAFDDANELVVDPICAVGEGRELDDILTGKIANSGQAPRREREPGDALPCLE